MSRTASMIKNEGAYYPADNMWHEGQHEDDGLPIRHHTQPQTNTHPHAYMRIDPSYAAAYTQPQTWPMSTNSGTSTPTPLFLSSGYGPPQSMSYPGFTPINQQDPTSSEMSPQSSQGGWGSTTSSDSTEHPARRMRTSGHRAVSPMSVMRPDGIRKKNARFEIPQDRNLHNIDSLISATTDESERKELKQQKRLLRNRQAALDSRQRKKSHTEKLEQEKKIWSDEKQGLEDNIARAHEHYQAEIMQLRAQYDYHLRELEFQRDEAVRTKTIETQDLRRQNNALKEVVRDLENQRKAHQYASSTPAEITHSHQDNYTPDFNSFDHLGIDDNWDAGSLFGNEDYNKMDHSGPAQQSTPKPHPAKVTVDTSKSDVPFSWNAFYMCLLFGAFIASKSTSSTTSSQLQDRIPALSEDYRAEAGAVLKAVLASTPESAGSLFPSPARNPHEHAASTSNLDAMHTTLTTPSRHQELVSAFSLSAASYNHINHPEGLDLEDSSEHGLYAHTPTPLERQFADMQRQHADVDRVLNRGAERSVFWDRVPAKVLRDFREMVGNLD